MLVNTFGETLLPAGSFGAKLTAFAISLVMFYSERCRQSPSFPTQSSEPPDES
jgi:hypothetical protein